MLDFLRSRVKNLVVVDTEKAMADLGSTRVMNLILLGAALRSGALGFTDRQIREAVIARIPPKFHELNLRALDWSGGK